MASVYEPARYTKLDRQTILRSFAATEESFRRYYCREEGMALLNRLKEVEGTSAYAFRKKELIRNLNEAGMICRMEDDLNSLEEIVLMLPSSEYMDRNLLEVLYKVYSIANSPAEQIKKLVRRLGDAEYQTGSVRLAILKQFLKNTTYHTNPVIQLITEHEKQNGNSLLSANSSSDIYAKLADEYLFDVISKKLSKSDKRKYHLLSVCDDLEKGRFKANGNTKVALYMFAFAFDMTVFMDPERDEYIEDRDIEKNLFADFYSNSLLRFISDDYKNNFRSYEAEPLGDGINYKNFAEVIYLYYLSKKDISISERVNRAEKKISECSTYVQSGKTSREQKEISLLGTSDRFTYIYKEMCSYIVRDLSEEELVPFICNNYIIDADNNSKAKVMDDSSTYTAAFYYYRGSDFFEQSFVDVVNEKQYFEDVWGRKDDFIELVKKMIEILCSKKIIRDKKISRLDILRMYYYKGLSDDSLEAASLMDIFDDMRIKCNEILGSSRYQEISEKNIFDVFVLIMLYRNINVV